MKVETQTIDLNSPVSFCGGGGGGGGGGFDVVTTKMDRDNSATQQSLDNALGNENAWSGAEINSHAAVNANAGINGWAENMTGNIGGCTGCHLGAYDTHY